MAIGVVKIWKEVTQALLQTMETPIVRLKHSKDWTAEYSLVQKMIRAGILGNLGMMNIAF